MFLGEIILEYRNNKKISQRDFAKLCNLSHSYIAMLEKNSDSRTGKPICPTLETIKAIANGMRTDVDSLLKLLNDEQKIQLKENLENKFFLLPILGRIPAGDPLLADENIEGYLPIDPLMYSLTSPNGLFFLRVQGESMNKVVSDGSYVLIKKQDYAENGDVIVAIVNGDDEATLKRYKELENNFIMLEPESTNSEFQPRIIGKDTSFKIVGKVIGDFKKW